MNKGMKGMNEQMKEAIIHGIYKTWLIKNFNKFEF